MNDDVTIPDASASAWKVVQAGEGPCPGYNINLTESEYAVAMASGSARLHQTTRWRSAGVMLACLSVGGLVAWLFGGKGPFAGVTNFLVFMLGFALFFVWVKILHRAQLNRLAAGAIRDYRVMFRADGLDIESSRVCSRWRWDAVIALVQRSDAILVCLKGYQTLMFPRRCLADDAQYAECIARLESFSGLKATVRPLAAPDVPDQRGLRALADLASNLWAGLLFLLFQRGAAARVRGTGWQIVWLTLLSVLLGILVNMLQADSDGHLWQTMTGGHFYWSGLAACLLPVLCVLACVWLVGSCAVRPRIIEGTVAMLDVIFVLEVLALPLDWGGWVQASQWVMLVWILLLLWSWLACVVALVCVLELPATERVAAVFGVLCLFVALSFVGQEARLWYPAGGSDDAAGMGNFHKVTAESVLYSQPALLDTALAGVKAGRPGVPELYLLAFGGTGSQNVFLHEVTSVEQLFAERFGTVGHSVVLVNSPESIGERPLATTIALRRALADIGAKMNRDEDILFLFMTSHGAQDFHFSLELWPYTFDELTPQVLRRMLDDAGIKNRVILVSACYSGGFIAPLAGPDTLVMTASRADRSSHGCVHGADWTFFGRAYFDEALRKTRSFEDAFGMAATAVALREKDEGLTASEPQIAVGPAVRGALRAWESQSGPRTEKPGLPVPQPVRPRRP